MLDIVTVLAAVAMRRTVSRRKFFELVLFVRSSFTDCSISDIDTWRFAGVDLRMLRHRGVAGQAAGPLEEGRPDILLGALLSILRLKHWLPRASMLTVMDAHRQHCSFLSLCVPRAEGGAMRGNSLPYCR